MRIIIASMLLMIFLFGCLGIHNETSTSSNHLACLLPNYVKEESFTAENFEHNLIAWDSSPGCALKKSTEAKKGESSLEISYSFNSRENNIDFTYHLSKRHFEAERLRFWLKGDGSQNQIQIFCRYQNNWLPLQIVSLSPVSWQHIEIAASNPIYSFYDDITDFKFSVLPDDSRNLSGKVLIDDLELVRPKLVMRPIKENHPPGPVFDTWGGIGGSNDDQKERIALAKNIGINLHLVPIGFPTEDQANRLKDLDGAANRLILLNQGNLRSGIAFYNTPPQEFINNHEDLLVKNELGEINKTGGCFLSPWNPESYRIWSRHIIDSLTYLKEKDILKYVDVVFLGPGEESEISFEWSHIWAFDDHALMAYHEYLNSLYEGDITKLNEDWNKNYMSFLEIMPPSSYYPDREHWVFLDFYRYSMLKWCVQLSDAVKEVFSPKYWLWLPHGYPDYPGRFYSSRYPLFYAENLKRLGLMDYAHIAALDWQSIQDVENIKKLDIVTIGEVDVEPTEERLQWTFEQSTRFNFDGVYIGIMENLSQNGDLTSVGNLAKEQIAEFNH